MATAKELSDKIKALEEEVEKLKSKQGYTDEMIDDLIRRCKSPSFNVLHFKTDPETFINSIFRR